MDVIKVLKNVNTLSDYIAFTQDVTNQLKNVKVQFNMTTILSLKKVRSLEIEYFNKSEVNGAACLLFEIMLVTPPSKTWGVLGKEMACLLQYWFDAVRKHLISHNMHWWIFLKMLLKFVKTLRTKDPTMPNLLVEYIAEALLDLASHDQPDGAQRREILSCLNVFCAEAGREIRLALRKRFAGYFAKLSVLLASAAAPCQLAILETLLRWLLPRHEKAVRLQAAAKWFPAQLYSEATVNLFLDKLWMDFFQDARDFLNVHNRDKEVVISVVCRELVVGHTTIVTGSEPREAWLDINAVEKCVSVLLDPKLLEAIGATTDSSCEALIISNEDAITVQMLRDPELKITLKTSHPPHLTSSIPIAGSDSCDVSITVSSRSDLARVDKALRCVFADKYHLLLNLNKEPTLSPECSNNLNDCELDTRFSHPVEVRRRKHSGYIVRNRNPVGWNSPSTASTSSLAQLHDKLESLPHFRYDKEPVSVCVRPALSSVTEVTETDDKQSLNTTLKYRSYGVCHKNLKTYERNKQSDGEVTQRGRKKISGRHLSPVVNDNTPSCLLVATIGSADESVINDTLERISKSKEYSTDNIVDLLVKEALCNKQPGEKDKLLDSGVNTGDKKTQDVECNLDEIENTPGADNLVNKRIQMQYDVNISPSDESNTEVINDTPLNYVSVRKRNRKVVSNDVDPAEKTSFDIEAVEEFFSQHFSENKAGEIVISPTLAKKINETSSEASEDFEYQYLLMNEKDTNQINGFEMNEIDIIDCLNDMVDKVCHNFDKCTGYLNLDNSDTTADKHTINQDLPLQVVTNTYEEKSKIELKNNFKSIKLKYTTGRKSPKRNIKKRKNKKTTKATAKMSTIIEDVNDNEFAEQFTTDKEIVAKNINCDEVGNNSVIVAEITAQTLETPEASKLNGKGTRDKETPILKRKRKLYSPKDDNVGTDRNMIRISETEDDDIALSEFKSSKNKTQSRASCYKDIEKERKRIRRPRNRKSSRNAEPPSPRATKMNALFDQLKQTVESNEKITLADKKADVAVYNFSSDSEDDFIKKKIEVQKRNSTTTVGSFESTMTTRYRKGRNVNYTEHTSSNEKVKKKTPAKRKKAKRQNTKPKATQDVHIDLVDERMRDNQPVDLNASFVINKEKNSSKEPKLQLDKAPEPETITEDNGQEQKKKPVTKNKNTHTKARAAKAAALVMIHDNDNDNDSTDSPLPGLVVESAFVHNDDTSSVLGNMLNKFKKIYEEGPDTVNETNTTQNLLSDMDRNNLSITNHSNIDLIAENDACHDSVRTRNINNTKNKRNRKVTKGRNSKSATSDIFKANDASISIVGVPNTDDIKSIPSEGITGHGVMDELPPDPKSINKTFRPRSLELEDLDQSMKDYFTKLTKEINTIDEKTDKSDNSTRKRVSADYNYNQERSPVVSVTRLSYDDISKWLPSRRTSDSSFVDSNTAKSPQEFRTTAKTDKQQTKQMNKQNNDKEFDRIVSDRNKNCVSYNRNIKGSESNDSDNNEIVETVSVYELNTDKSKSRIPSSAMSRDSHDIINKKNVKSNEKPDKESINNENLRDLFCSLFKNNEDLEYVHNKRSVKNAKSGAKGDAYSDRNDSDTDEKNKNTSKLNLNARATANVNIEKTNRKSMISPIKLFEEFQPISDNKSQSSDEEYVKNIRSIFSKRSVARSTRKTTSKQSNLGANRSSLESRLSSSTKIDSVKAAVKRKSSPILVRSKKTKVDVHRDVVVTPESGPSVCSVNDWFARNEPAAQAERFDASFTDSIQNVMEKLDTTLVEIHQTTSKRLVCMFVDAQKKLTQLKDDRRAMYKHVAQDMFAALLKIMDDKFDDLDKRSQKMDNEFMDNIKKQAADVIKEDCKQKRAMVLLLKEDVQAVIDHMNRERRPDFS